MMKRHEIVRLRMVERRVFFRTIPVLQVEVRTARTYDLSGSAFVVYSPAYWRDARPGDFPTDDFPALIEKEKREHERV